MLVVTSGAGGEPVRHRVVERFGVANDVVDVGVGEAGGELGRSASGSVGGRSAPMPARVTMAGARFAAGDGATSWRCRCDPVDDGEVTVERARSSR